MLPLLQSLSKNWQGLFGLILTRTRESAFHIAKQIIKLGEILKNAQFIK